METLPDGRKRLVVSVPAIHCGGCIRTIEEGLTACAGVEAARVNLTLRRVTVTLAAGTDPSRIVEALAGLGYPATPVAPESVADSETRKLLRALAVAGFGAANVMALSVAVWAGANGKAGEAFHLISAAIAVPVVAYSGRPFFRAAVQALRAGRMSMEVPISLAVLLALGLSLFEMLRGGGEVFFDAAVTLLFFLLIGRVLDRWMRDRARSAVAGLAPLAVREAVRVRPDGALEEVATAEIAPGDTVRVVAGERVPLDGRVVHGETDTDRSFVTGEAEPTPAVPGTRLEAGVLNLTGPVDLVAEKLAEESFVARVSAMLEAAEQSRGRYVRIADRAARIYAPAVHLLALATFGGWLTLYGDWHAASFAAISVLIITCPCALGLAVPAVHVAAAGRLLRDGILLKDGSALERLAEVDRVVFDKTGTLTSGTPRLTAHTLASEKDRAVAKALAQHSRHPAAQALDASLTARAGAALANVREVPGAGIEARADGVRARLGHVGWVAEIAGSGETAGEGLSFAYEGGPMAAFTLCETLRADAAEAVDRLRQAGLDPEVVSGDSEDAVRRVAGRLGIARAVHGCTPEAKTDHLQTLRASGHHVLMVGDGLNDAPALAAGHASMAPGEAAEAGRLAADLVFVRGSLTAVAEAHAVARRCARLVRQNFGLAAAYNAVAIPLAVAGLVTPLIAALAMSGSSILVVANAMRVGRPPGRGRTGAVPTVPGSLQGATA